MWLLVGSVLSAGSTVLTACTLLLGPSLTSGEDADASPAGDASTDAPPDAPSTAGDADAPDDAGVPPGDTCPPAANEACDGGVSWRGRCYWTVPNTRETDGTMECGRGGGYLATTTCAEEWQVLRNLVSGQDGWLGARRDGASWTWRTRERFAFEAWAVGHPLSPSDGGTDCINVNMTSLEWENDVACNATRLLLCERGPFVVPP